MDDWGRTNEGVRVRELVRMTLARCVGDLSREDREDLEVAALVAGWRAARTYRDDRGASWQTWIIANIRHAIQEERRALNPCTRGQRDAIRRAEREGREPPPSILPPISLDDPHPVTGTPRDCRDPAPGPEEVAFDREGVETVRRALRVLHGRRRAVVVARLWRGETWVAIGRRWGVCPSRASEVYNDALRLLRTALGEH